MTGGVVFRATRNAPMDPLTSSETTTIFQLSQHLLEDDASVSFSSPLINVDGSVVTWSNAVPSEAVVTAPDDGDTSVDILRK